LPPELIAPQDMSAQHTALSEIKTPPARSDINPLGLDVASLAKGLFEHARKDTKLRVIPAVERELVIQALIETQGNQVQAAKLLGVTRATLRKRVEKFQIKQGLAIR
jgi:transcriptional regulator with GAF, ATPase, and Fis domain